MTNYTIDDHRTEVEQAADVLEDQLADDVVVDSHQTGNQLTASFPDADEDDAREAAADAAPDGYVLERVDEYGGVPTAYIKPEDDS